LIPSCYEHRARLDSLLSMYAVSNSLSLSDSMTLDDERRGTEGWMGG